MSQDSQSWMFDRTIDSKTEYSRQMFERDVHANPGKAWPYLNMALWYHWRGKCEFGGKEYNYLPNARECYDKAVAIEKDSPYCLSCRAIFLATCPDADCRDGRKALSDANRAMELAQGTSRMTISGKRYRHYFQALAAAHAETGDFAQAIKLQETALKHAEENSNTATRQDLGRLRSILEGYRSGQPARSEKGIENVHVAPSDPL